MKKIYLTILITLLPHLTSMAFDGKKLFITANNYYKNGLYDSAIIVYKQILNAGFESAEIYYNIGNAYFKKKEIPFAILFYEKALKLKPNDEEINFNLKLAQTMVVDKITPLPEFFLKRWWRNFKNLISTNDWAKLALISFIVMLVLILLYLFSPQFWIRKTSFYFSIFLLIFFTIAIINSFSLKNDLENRSTAIIKSPSLVVKSSPDENGTELFVLHEGTKVWIIDQVGTWLRIKIADGNNGWIKNEEVEII